MSNPGAASAAGAGTAAAAAQVMVAVREVSRTFGSGHTAVQALKDVSVSIKEGQLTALIGRSGSGKTSLLNVIGGLDRPTSGTVTVAGQDVTAMGERERMLFRRTWLRMTSPRENSGSTSCSSADWMGGLRIMRAIRR